ncbi:MAG TPA: hypothetical protein VHL58_07130 [Thermoanaerobaculia bacterium]|nr:hypothetical protein [Thermoanaerobaculia bacterium]
MKRLQVSYSGPPGVCADAVSIASSMMTSARVTVVDAGGDPELRLFLDVDALSLTNHGARGYVVVAFLDHSVHLLEGLSPETFRQVEGSEKTRLLVNSFDGYWNPLLVAWGAGAPLDVLVTRVASEVLAEIEAIEPLSIEAILGRPLRVVTGAPLCEDSALLEKAVVAGESGMTLQLPKGVLRIDGAIGSSDAEASENLRELKRSRIPRMVVEPIADDDHFDARLRHSLRRILTDIATINSCLLEAPEDARPDYYRRAAQSHLYDVWQNADILLQSVEERAPAHTSLGGFTLRWVRLGVLKEGFNLSVSPGGSGGDRIEP